MKIKKYEVYDMAEAMRLIKKDLGPDAVILSTKKIIKNNNFGLFSKPMIEVTAAADPDDRIANAPVERSTAGMMPEDIRGHGGNQQFKHSAEKQPVDKLSELINTLGLNKFEGLVTDISEIKKQLLDMKSALSENMVIDLSATLKEIYNNMRKNGVDEIIAYKFLKRIEARASSGLTKNQIANLTIQLLSDLIPIEKDYFSSLKQKVVALVGPTGVGKTTTIAKIAANLSLKLKKKVCLITVDNFRIGAVEQLRTYAEIVDIPLFVASSPEELEEILNRCSDYEYVFVDSMGRSQFDTEQIDDLLRFLEIDKRITVALVLSMSSNHNEMFETFERYSKLMPEYLIFTKLDETRFFGPLVNLPIRKKTPLLLLSMGQNVPDDMEVPDGRKIAKRVIGEIPKIWSDR